MTQTTYADDVGYYMDDDITLLSMPLQPTGDSDLEFVAVMPSGDLTTLVDGIALSDEDNYVPKPIIIDIDHPFLFLIRDKASQDIWFIGAVYQPNLWSDDASTYSR